MNDARIDVLLPGTVASLGEADEADPAGLLVRGRPVLLQRDLLELCTRKGELAFRPGRGTRFLDRLGAGRAVAGETGVLQAFASIVPDLISGLREDESSLDPPEDRIGSVRLERTVFAPGGVLILTVRIVPLSGERTDEGVVSLRLDVAS